MPEEKYKPCRLLLVEGDPFARFWMEHCLRLEAGIRLVGSLHGANEIKSFVRAKPVDLLLLNCDLLDHACWVKNLALALSGSPGARIICTGARLDPSIITDLKAPIFQGYIMKDEIDGNPVDAVHCALQGYWVMTASVRAQANQQGFFPPNPLELKPAPLFNGMQL